MLEKGRYEGLEIELRKELVRHTLFQGVAGPLAFLWAIGLGLFLILWSLPLLAGIWTVVVLLLGSLIAASYFSDRKVLELCTRLVIERHILLEKLRDLPSRTALQRGVDLLAEIVVKVRTFERGHGPDLRLRRVVANAHAMLLLLHEAASRADDNLAEMRQFSPEFVNLSARGIPL